MAGRFDSFLLRALEHGCNNCGEKVDSFYTVEFYFLPSGLVRKRHKDRAQNAIYCRECYEGLAQLPFLVDGKPHSVPTGKAIDVSKLSCYLCTRSFHHRQLYGIIASNFWVGVNVTESLPLAAFCAECAESCRISLLAKIR